LAKQRTVTRREFLARTAGAGVLAGSMVAGTAARAQVSPNERLSIGFIGLGGMGSGHLHGFAGSPKWEVRAVCDVHQGRRENGAKVVADAGGQATPYRDFREVIDHDDIDAVLIATPDHWHALTTVMACESGKDVYCEKPMALTIYEQQRMIQAARRYGRIVQIGTQQRSQSHIRHAVELVRSGRIGKVTLCRAWLGGGGGGGWPPNGQPPAELDWDLWLGPAPWVEYNPARFGNFRQFWDYSGGGMTDWGTHLIDILHWGTGEDAPVSIEATGRYADDGIYEMPESLEVIYQYPTHTMIWSQPPPEPLPMGQPSYGMYFEGTNGRLFVDREKYTIEPEDADKEPLGKEDFILPRVASHSDEWYDCIFSRELPTSDAAVAHRSTSSPHLGNIAFRIGRKLRWDGVAERFVDDDEANRWIARPYREPWVL